MSDLVSGSLERVTGFCRLLRERGLPVTPAASVDAMRALEWIDLGDRMDLYFALRTLLATRRRDQPLFDASFAEWWGGASAGIGSAGDHASRRERPPARRAHDQREGAGDALALSRWLIPRQAVDRKSTRLNSSHSH